MSSHLVSLGSFPSLSRTQASSESSEEEADTGMEREEQLESRRLRRKERRESKRRHRTTLREWCRTRQGNDVPKEDPNGVRKETEELLKGLENIEDLETKRKEYHNRYVTCPSVAGSIQTIMHCRSVGIFVSSIKLEWSKYFESSFPLTYFMERCGMKKLKALLAEVPNLILTGDGGFMRVVTVEHAKALCDPFPPEGLNSTGTTVCPSHFTRTSSDPKYSVGTYIGAIQTEELTKTKGKGAFFKRLNARNASIHKRHSIAAITGESSSALL